MHTYSLHITQNQPGWFSAVRQITCQTASAGEPVFGADEVRTKLSIEYWYDLGWNDIFNGESQTKFINVNKTISVGEQPEQAFVWGRNSADQAYTTYQNPSRIFIHASDLLN